MGRARWVIVVGVASVALLAWLLGPMERSAERTTATGPSETGAPAAESLPGAFPAAPLVELEPDEPTRIVTEPVIVPSWHGVVLDADGQPLAGARVFRLAASSRMSFGAQLPTPEVPDPFEHAVACESAADGTFRMDWAAPPEDGNWALLVCHPSHVSRAVRCVDGLAAGGDCGTLRLERAGMVRGRMVAADGSPAAGADIEARLTPFAVTLVDGDLVWILGLREKLLTTRTDEGGRFELGSLPAANLVIRAQHVGHAPYEGAGRELATGGVLELGDLTLSRGDTVSGRILDAEGRPIAGAEVRGMASGLEVLKLWEHGVHFELERARTGGFDRRGRTAARTCVTASDADGRFELSGLTLPLSAIIAAAPGFEPQALDDVPAGTRDLELRMEPLGRLRLRLLDDVDGRVLENSELLVKRLMKNDGQVSDRSDVLPVERLGPGDFLVHDVCAAPLVAVVQEADRGRVGLRLAGLPAGTREGSRDVRVPRGVSLAGRVVNSSGQPMPSARVVLDAYSRDVQPILTGPVDLVVDAEGRFRSGPQPADDWVVSAQLKGHASTRQRLSLRPGESAVLEDLVLVRNAVLDVHVVGASGAPLAGVDVRVVEARETSPSGSSLASGNTNALGHVLLECAPGAVRLESRKAPLTLDLGTLAEGERRSVRAEAGGSVLLLGAVRDASGVLADINVSFKLPAGTIKTSTDGEGRWQLQVPAGQSGRLTARSPRGGIAWQSIVAPASGSLAADLAFGACVLRGRVVDSSSGVGLGGVSVQGWREDEPIGLGVRTSEDGRFELAHLQAGPLIVQAGGEHVSFCDETQVVVPAEREITLTVTRLGTVHGVVRLASGAPAPQYDCQVLLVRQASSDEPKIGYPDESGAFAIDGLAPGAYSLVVTRALGNHEVGFDRERAEKLAWLRVEIDVAPGQDVQQDLILPPGRP